MGQGLLRREPERYWKNICYPKKQQKAIAIGRKYDTLLEVYFDGQGYAQKDEIAQVRKYHKNPNMWDYFLRTRIAVDRLEDLLDEKRNLDKVQMLFADMEEREEAWKELERRRL